MKRFAGIALPATAVAAVVLFLAVHRLLILPGMPKFIAGSSIGSPAPYDSISYNWLSRDPFQDGKIWLTISNKMECHTFLFHIDERRVLGELKNAAPAFLTSDQTKVLCIEIRPPHTNRLRTALVQFLSEFQLTKNYADRYKQNKESVWLVGLKDKSAIRLGKLHSSQYGAITLRASPDKRYALDRAIGNNMQSAMLLCDLARNEIQTLELDSTPLGWWSNSQILLQNTNRDLLLYDLPRHSISMFLNQSQIKEFYIASGLTNKPDRASIYYNRKADVSTFHFCDSNNRSSAEESYLVQLDSVSGKLKLIEPRFKFEKLDSFNDSQKLYLYSDLHTGSGAYVRDVATQQVRELVPRSSGGDRSFPRFYRDQVIYVRSNALWAINITGGNNRRLFPPPD